MTRLPGRAGELEELIGLEATVKLIRARGGLTIEIPSGRSGNTVLSDIVGPAACQKMIDFYGPGRLSVPMAGVTGRIARERAIKARAMEMIDAGASNAQIAIKCGLSRRTVQEYRRQYDRGDKSPQLTLPL